MYRALESERPDAHFHDPYARRMAGERGEAIIHALPHGESMAWAMVVRTAVLDELVLRCVNQGCRTVVNLGAGLDTRAYRLALPAKLRWLDVDLPDMVAYRRDCLDEVTAVCDHADMAADLSDAKARARVLASVSQGSGPVLVLTEGLLLYLAPGQVSNLARELHAQPLARWWLTDLITPVLMQMMGMRWRTQLAKASAPFRFAPTDSAAFFGALGWREAEFRSTWKESLRLNRSAPLAWMWGSFSPALLPGANERLHRMSGIALLERK